MKLPRFFQTVMSVTWNRPTALQLTKVFNRQFFALKSQTYAKTVVDNCHVCRSLKAMPKELHSQSSVDCPYTPCKSFAADVIRRFHQKIYVLRETFSSFTVATLQNNEDHSTLRSALISSVSHIRSSPHTSVLIRVDNAPGFVALKNDVQLKHFKYSLGLWSCTQ